MRSQKIKTIALCSVLSALGIVVLLLGSFIEMLDLTSAMLASMLITVAVIEAGRFWPWLTYAVITVISLLFLPNKLPAVAFLLAGYYPIIKEKLERLNKVLRWVIKIVVFNAALALLLTVLKVFFPGIDMSLYPGMGKTLMYISTAVLGNIAFVLYDIVLTRLISLYIFKLRNRFGIGRKK